MIRFVFNHGLIKTSIQHECFVNMVHRLKVEEKVIQRSMRGRSLIQFEYIELLFVSSILELIQTAKWIDRLYQNSDMF